MGILGFIVILFPLVVVHELGHFMFAKIFGVKAEAFSVGFGPIIWARQWGETEYRLSAIPLGGYVKLLGEDPEAELPDEDKGRALGDQVPWKRFFIFFGGPLFNFIWAALVFMVIMAIGEPNLASVIGRVLPASEAYENGFRTGDKVLKINGESVTMFREMGRAISESPNKEMDFLIKRIGESSDLSLKFTPSTEIGFSKFGEQTQVGKLEGIIPRGRSNLIGISNPNSIAGTAGIKTGDVVTQFNGEEVKSYEVMEYLYSNVAPASSISLTYQSVKDGSLDEEKHKVQFDVPSVKKSLAVDFGLHSSELFVKKVFEETPASAAGLKEGDRILAVDDTVLVSFFGLKDNIQKSASDNGKVNISWERNGESMSSEMKPTEKVNKGALLEDISDFTIGIAPLLEFAEGPMINVQIWNPFILAYKGTEKMVMFSWRNLVSIGKMFMGDVSVKTLGGPLLIGKIAGQALQNGLIDFLRTMAILSVGLGILNILPIPVLDGGHLLLLGIEVVRGKPLSIRHTELIQQVGLGLILLLMSVVMINDFSRFNFFD